jgi:hypothetical protein
MRASLQYNNQIKKSAGGAGRRGDWLLVMFLFDYQQLADPRGRAVIDL